MRVPVKLGFLIFCCMLALLSACGGQYSSNRDCTYNSTACSEPPAFNCCSQWGDYPEPDKME